MKCPKCSYLGFETGARCRNCGYDFSLAAPQAPVAIDLPLRDTAPRGPGGSDWADDLHLAGIPVPPSVMPVVTPDPLGPMPLDTLVTTPPSPAVATRTGQRTAASSLPLFQRPADDDEPLIKLPTAPRAPLAVRRTPDKPRLRAVPKRAAENAASRELDRVPALEFPDEPEVRPAIAAEPPAPARRQGVAAAEVVSGPLRRLSAALADHAILLTIDVIVVYFTLKMASLPLAEWSALPLLPLAAFLALVKVAYFGAFTLVGGQTIGKMAARIRVVGDDGRGLDPTQAVQRTLIGAISLLAVGAGLVPLLLAADRRGVHDRVARTRVIRS